MQAGTSQSDDNVDQLKCVHCKKYVLFNAYSSSIFSNVYGVTMF